MMNNLFLCELQLLDTLLHEAIYEKFRLYLIPTFSQMPSFNDLLGRMLSDLEE